MALAAQEEPALQLDYGSSDEEDLSEEQIQELLNQAETRLRERAVSKSRPQKVATSLPKLNTGTLETPYVRVEKDIARVDGSRLLDPNLRALSNQVRKVEEPVRQKQKQAEEKKATAGPDWFGLPRLDPTPELKQDIKLIQMRSVLDPHRHYRKEGKAQMPEYAQVGTLIEGPTEFYSARIQKKDRKKTFVEEVLAAEAENGRFKRKYEEVQTAKTSGKKAYYKALKAKRSKKG
ncbi:dTDP-fucopyranose mutase [Coniosporium apollinis]|uniref:dTDP-fucopyranose mutase n=1 Tax=Coniosporium apollinis TaxID=61459 RepID=A0ABQ9NQE7_9PEZI|nr:dTDP-fucopyranose mutase [Coniosporium apollinis]